MSESYNVTPMRPNGAAPAGDYEIETTPPPAADDPMAVVPNSVRALAESMIAQNREAYDRARESVDEAVSMMEVTIERAGEFLPVGHHIVRPLRLQLDIEELLRGANDCDRGGHSGETEALRPGQLPEDRRHRQRLPGQRRPCSSAAAAAGGLAFGEDYRTVLGALASEVARNVYRGGSLVQADHAVADPRRHWRRLRMTIGPFCGRGVMNTWVIQ